MKNICQSCAMPLSEDPKGGGTNSDGTKSKEYCSYCFERGQFTGPNLTAKEMQDFCMGKLRERGMMQPIAWLLTRNIPRLKRWKPAR